MEISQKISGESNFLLSKIANCEYLELSRLNPSLLFNFKPARMTSQKSYRF